MKRFCKKNFIVIAVFSLILSSFSIQPSYAEELIVPSANNNGDRRVLFFEDFEDGKTAYWQVSGGAPELAQTDETSVYSVQAYDHFNFENVNNLVNFRLEFNMKYCISAENRGNAWPAIYLKSLNPTQRYELFFESKPDRESVNLRRNGVNTLEVPLSFYDYNEEWIYIKIDVEGSVLRLYVNDPKNPVLTFDDSAPLISGPMGFARGRTEYFYIDNLLVTAAPLRDGEADTAFANIDPIPEKTDNKYGEVYIDTDFSNGLDHAFRDIGAETIVTDGSAIVTGRLAIGKTSWSNYSVEIDMALMNKQIVTSEEPFFKFRCKDEFNYYMLRTNAGGSALQVYKCENGAQTWVGQCIAYLTDRTQRLRMDFYDDTMTFYIRSTSYPDFEYPFCTITDSAIANGGIEICKPSYLDSIRIDRLKIRRIEEPGNLGPRPAPVPFAVVAQNPFETWTDIDGHWAAPELKFLGSLGALSGYPNNTFRPDEPIAVNEALKILCTARMVETEENSDYWAKAYIDAAVKNAWIAADTFDSFDRPIRRGELIKIIAAAMDKDADISAIAQGDEFGNLNLSQAVTRSEAAVMIARCISEVFRPQDNTAFTSFVEYPLAFANPYKGFRNLVGEPYVTMVGCTFNWNDIEANEHDGVEKILAAAEKKFEGFPENNVKGVVGVILNFPPSNFWPSDLTPGDYTSEQFKKRLENLIEKLAIAFDNDPRVAIIQMRIIGKWGEMQDPAPTPEVAALMSECFYKYFKNKKVLTNIVPHISMYQEHDFGTHWDSFAHWGNINLLDYFETESYKEIWKTQMTIGETAFDWGEPLGLNPNDGVVNYGERYIEIIRGTHCSSLSWLSQYDKRDPDTTAAAIPIQKALGYRYVLQNAKYTQSVRAGGELSVAFNVANTGSAPMYYNELVELSLLTLDTHEVVWSQVFDKTDIRTWLPDDDYSCTPVYTVSDCFQLPTDLQDGIYTLALSILDSAGGNVPSIRFANTNYYKGGRTPIGNIAVSSAEGQNETKIPPLDESQFADLFTDRLHYIYNP